MSKDDKDCEVMNQLFDNEEKSHTDDDLYYNHWRPTSICNNDGEKIRDLTKEEQRLWIMKQKLKERT